MANAQSFGGALARVRRERGFPSAYAFYHQRDGRRTLGLTFRNYMNLEQGKSLPRVERLEAILLALGLREQAPAARELVGSYLAALGIAGLLRFFPPAESPSPARESWRLARLAAQRLSVQRSLEQWRLIARDFKVFLCDNLLVTTPGGLSLPRLAKEAGMTLSAAKRAVRALAAAGLAKVSGAHARSTMDEGKLELPPKVPAMAGVAAALFKNNARLIQRGRLLQNFNPKVRLTEAHLKQLQRDLDDFMNVPLLYETLTPSQDSAVYMIRAQIYKIFPQGA